MPTRKQPAEVLFDTLAKSGPAQDSSVNTLVYVESIHTEDRAIVLNGRVIYTEDDEWYHDGYPAITLAKSLARLLKIKLKFVNLAIGDVAFLTPSTSRRVQVVVTHDWNWNEVAKKIQLKDKG